MWLRLKQQQQILPTPWQQMQQALEEGFKRLAPAGCGVVRLRTPVIAISANMARAGRPGRL